MTEQPTCPCGQPVTQWTLAGDDQAHPPFPPDGKLGDQIPILVDHADGTRHLVHHQQAT